MKQAVLLVGGKGTRLAAVAGDLPKPMVLVAGKPVLERAIERLATAGITDIHIFSGYQADHIEAYFGNGQKFGVQLTYHVESQPLGTAGGVVQALAQLDNEFVLIYGDMIFNVDFTRFEAFHRSKQSDLTLFLHPNDHPYDSDLVEIDEDARIVALHACPHPSENFYPNLVSAALYIVNKKVLEPWAMHEGTLDFAHDMFPKIVAQRGNMFGYCSREYAKDMGTPDRLARTEVDVASGKVDRGSLHTPRPAIFLDRDGTVLNLGSDYIRKPEGVVLEDGTAQALQLINRSEYLAVLITNQPVIARGEVSVQGLETIHHKMEQLLGRERAYLDALYYCPHHPDKGFAGERAEYKVECACRKPGIQMIEQAAKEMNIDLARSWFVGDTTTDIQTAKNAELRSVLVKSGAAGEDKKFDVQSTFTCQNILEAAQLILSKPNK